MKTKKFFMLLAAVLLSVSAFAQSGNNEPLKGDVNGDGTVDVADMVNIIQIMKDGGGAVGEKMCYWYAGTNNGNAVTAENCIDVASRIPESEIPETGSFSVAGQYVYFVMPGSRYIVSLVDANGSPIDYESSDVFGYRIYKTSDKVSGKISYVVEQIVYYWYVGTIPPTDPSNIEENTGLNKWTPIGTSLPTDDIKVAKSDTITWDDHTWYIAAPTDANFILYSAMNQEREDRYWDISTFYVNNTWYTLWAYRYQSYQVVKYLHKP